MNGIIHRGGYQALHYFDAGGDGWIAASCPELEGVVEAWKPAYCMVGLPDFFPQITQRELMLWWRDKVPKAVRAALVGDRAVGAISDEDCREYHASRRFQHR